jgi:uroporphyrinogen decarboxylase
MTGRERVHTAMSRRRPDQVPREVGFTPALFERFKQETGSEDPAEYWDFDTANVGFKPAESQPDFSQYHPEGIPEGRAGEYGTVSLPGDFYHFTRRQYPLDHETTLQDLEEYPWPDYTPAYRHEHLEAEVQRLHEQGKYVTGFSGHMWEIAWQMTSMPKLMMQFIEAPDQAAYLLDRILENDLFTARRLVEAGVDCLMTGDDVGMQDRMMMSPAMWREWFKPRWGKIYREAKQINPEVQIWYHSDGMIEPIIPDLIEMGLDILNPVQPECMDQVKLKREYGDRLAFWGCVGTQTTFPFGTPDGMKAAVKHLIETVGEGGGLFLAPTHVLEPDVPWENILAFFEACEEYGRYE